MADSIEVVLGRQIALSRRAKGWRQKELAAALGVEPQTISRWERGAPPPPFWRLHQIAAALDTTAEALVTQEVAA